MALIRWDPFADLRSIHTQMDDVFNQMFTQHGLRLAPTTDVYMADDKTLVVEAHLPNFQEKEVDINVHNGALEIRAHHEEKDQDKDKRKYLVRESSSSFYRRVALPANTDEAKIKASFKDGVLKVNVPIKELPQPKKIVIDGGEKAKK